MADNGVGRADFSGSKPMAEAKKVQCYRCYAGNPADVAHCHLCGTLLKTDNRSGKKPAPLVASPTGALFGEFAEDMLITAFRAQKSREAKVAAYALATAAVMSVLRATLIPFLFSFAPNQSHNIAALTSRDVTLGHLCLAVGFWPLALWARREPLVPSIIAMSFFLTVAIPQVVAHPYIIGGGHFGKIVMMLVLLRAIIAGFMHRWVTATPILEPAH